MAGVSRRVEPGWCHVGRGSMGPCAKRMELTIRVEGEMREVSECLMEVFRGWVCGASPWLVRRHVRVGRSVDWSGREARIGKPEGEAT
jgi:hypothetical protein